MNDAKPNYSLIKTISYLYLVFMTLCCNTNLSFSYEANNTNDVVTTTNDQNQIKISLDKKSKTYFTKEELSIIEKELKYLMISYEGQGFTSLKNKISNLLIGYSCYEFEINLNDKNHILITVLKLQPLISCIKIRSNLLRLQFGFQENIESILEQFNVKKNGRLPKNLPLITRNIAKITEEQILTSAGLDSTITVTKKQLKNNRVQLEFLFYITNTNKIRSTDVIISGLDSFTRRDVIEYIFPIFTLDGYVGRSINYYKKNNVILERLKSFYNEKGFMNFQILRDKFVVSKKNQSKQSQSKYYICIKEGPRYQLDQLAVRDLTLDENNKLTKAELTTCNKIITDKNYNVFTDKSQKAIIRDIEDILIKSNRVGYSINVTTIKTDKDKVVFFFDIVAGIVSPIIKNLYINADKVDILDLRKFLTLKIGDQYNYESLKSTITRLRQLSYIQRVDFFPRINVDNKVDVFIIVNTYSLQERVIPQLNAGIEGNSFVVKAFYNDRDFVSSTYPLSVNLKNTLFTGRNIIEFFKGFKKYWFSDEEDKTFIEKIGKQLSSKTVLQIGTAVPTFFVAPTNINLLLSANNQAFSVSQPFFLTPKLSLQVGLDTSRQLLDTDDNEAINTLESISSFSSFIKRNDISATSKLMFNNSNSLFYNAPNIYTSGYITSARNTFSFLNKCNESRASISFYNNLFQDSRVILSNTFGAKYLFPFGSNQTLNILTLKKFGFNPQGYDNSPSSFRVLLNDNKSTVEVGTNLSFAHSAVIQMPLPGRTFYEAELVGLRSMVLNYFAHSSLSCVANKNVIGIKNDKQLLNTGTILQISIGCYASVTIPLIGVISIGVALAVTDGENNFSPSPSVYVCFGTPNFI